MAPLKLPLQVSCPNCQAGNLPGSPYCSRCGASLVEVPVGPPPVIKPVAPPEDPIKKLINEGQDPGLVRQTYDRALAIMTIGETIEYVSIAGRGGIGHTPDCVVATSKRVMLYHKKRMGKVELDDCYWRDVRDATMKEGKNGVTLTLNAIQGWHLTIEAMPKAQAWRVYEIALEHNDRLREQSQQSTLAVAAPAAPVRASAPAPIVELPQATAAPVSIVPLPTRPVAALPSAPSAHTGLSASGPMPTAPYHEQGSAPAPVSTPVTVPLALLTAMSAANFVPTPESVLQSILQRTQDVGDGGEPTRPMQLSAAAFQAPALLDAQPVTIRDTNTDTDPRMRSGPPLTTLEQIAIFSGSIAFNQTHGNEQSAPLTPYSMPISGPLSQPSTDRLPSGPMPSSPRLTSGALLSKPLNSAPLAESNMVAQSVQPSTPEESKPVSVPAQLFDALPSGLLPRNNDTNSDPGAFTDAELRAESPNDVAWPDMDTPMEMVDIMNIMMPTSPIFSSGPLPLPGSMTSGPLLAATPQSGPSSVVHDSRSLATQRLYMEQDSDADRPTDINLGQYSVQQQPAPRNSKSASVPKQSAPRNSSGTSSRASSVKGNGDDPISKMKQLKMLLDAGFITEGDYEAKKADILARFF